MKLLTVVFAAAFVAVALTQEDTTTAPPETTTSTTTTEKPMTTTTGKPKTTTTAGPTSSTTSTTTTSTTTSTTTTTKPSTTSAPTTMAPSTTSAPPKPKEATLGNYTLKDGAEVCAVLLMKVVVTQNATSYPFVNGTLVQKASQCGDSQTRLWIRSVDGYELQIEIEHDTTNFYIAQLSVHAGGLSADRGNLTQFSTPMKQFYKCASASEVSLGEDDVKIIFSEMKYQAFRKEKSADFVGSEFECVSDYHSDVVIIAIGCALALLVVVILVAYLIARRRNRQRGYQSV